MSTQWYGSLNNRILERATKGQPKPVVGMGVTVTHYTDRSAGTIIDVQEMKGGLYMISIQEDQAIRADNNGMSECQDYTFVQNPNGILYHFRQNHAGMWQQINFNEKTKRWNLREGCGLRLGERDAYHDYSF